MKKKYKWILFLIIAVLSCGAYGAVLLKPLQVEGEVVSPGNLEHSFTVSGTVLPVMDTVLNSVSAGLVVSLPYQVGSAVPAGEIIMETGAAAQMDLDIQREQYSRQLSAARQQYDRLFGERGTAAAAFNAARSEFNLADKNYENGRALFEQGGFISQSELDTLKTERDLLYQKFLQAKEDDSETAREYYLAQVTSCEKQLAMLEDTRGPGAVRMPYNGVVWELYTSVGAYMAPNQPVAKIYEPGRMKIEASLLSEDALLIKPDQTAVAAYADGTTEEAAVSFISRVATKKLSSIGMEENRCSVELIPAVLPEYAGAGQQVDVTFTVVAAEQVLTVPSTAIVAGQEAGFVYVIEGGRAVPREIEAGKKSGGRVEILSGIVEGDVVISDPYNEKIKSGSRVSAAAG